MARFLLSVLLMGLGMLGLVMSNVIKHDSDYPKTTPVENVSKTTFDIWVISDLDKKSMIKKENIYKTSWISYLKKGRLMWNPTSDSNDIISISWNAHTENLTSGYALGNRGMELSELVTSNGKILSFDDKTGIVYSIENNTAYLWNILINGNGIHQKTGFKSEWASVKDGVLYVGSTGNEWRDSTTGVVLNRNEMWVKEISTSGEIRSFNWTDNYVRLRQAFGIESPGYMIHEAAEWSDILQKWVFLPRKCSKELYHFKKDEHSGCSVLLIADDSFSSIKSINIENSVPERGFSSFKFLPHSKDTIIIALRTEEYKKSDIKDYTATYITAFNIEGTILMPDLLIEENKFEGFEFV